MFSPLASSRFAWRIAATLILLLVGWRGSAAAQSYSCEPFWYPGGDSTWPPAPGLSSIVVPPSNIGGQDLVVFVFLNNSVGFGCTLTLAVSNSHPSVVRAASTIVMAGASTSARWSTSPVSVATPVTIGVRDTASRTLSGTVSILPPACTAPSVGSSLPNQTVDPGQSANFSVSASGTAPLSFQWFLNGSPVPGQTGTSFNTGPLSANATVFVRVSNSCGTVDSNVATVTMRCTPPSITAQPTPASQLADAGGTAVLNVSAGGTGALTYEWYEGASPDTSRPLGTANNSTFTTPKLYGGDKTVWVRVRNSCGFADSSSVTIRMRCNLNVSPRFLQTDPRWAFNIYDGTTSTIGDLGSALTSLGMALQHAGAKNLNTPMTRPLDPGSLNDFMKLLGTLGYDSSGNVLFPSTTQFVGSDQSPFLSLNFTTLGAGEDGWDSITSPMQTFGALDASLCAVDPSPVIVRVRSPKSGQYPSHYVLVTGKDINASGTVKYTIADPAALGMDLNSAPYVDAQNRPEFRTRGAVTKVDPAADQSLLEVSSGHNASIMVINSAGQQTGRDPASGKHLAGIPRSASYMDRLSNSLTGVVRGTGHSVQIGQPAAGQYRVVATGVQAGPYEIQFHGFRNDGKPQPPVSLKGTVAVGSSLTFDVNYSPTVPAIDVKLVPGDITGDGKADCADIAVVRTAFGKRLGQPGFDPRADVVIDNAIDIRDLNAVAQRLPVGSVCGPTLSVTKSGTGSGEVTSSPAGIACGSTCSAQIKEATQVTLTAVPASNSLFAGWSGACSGAAPTATVTMSADRACSARFELITKTLSVSKFGGAAGSIKSNPGGIDCEPSCSAQFPINTNVTLTATPAQFSVFKGWSGDCAGNAPSVTVSLSNSKTCAAEFQAEPVSIVYQAHVTDIGWLPEVSDGAVAGTTGQSRAMEAIRIRATGGCSVTYQAHVANIGWLPEVSDGAIAGTTGQRRRMEALRVRLNCDPRWHVLYQAHIGDVGWMQEVADGQTAGTTGQSRRLEAVKIRVVFTPCCI